MDDILGEGSDDSDSEKKKPEEQEEEEQEGAPQPREPKAPGAHRGHTLEPTSSSERSAADGRGPR